jgi:hypothetical protein
VSTLAGLDHGGAATDALFVQKVADPFVRSGRLPDPVTFADQIGVLEFRVGARSPEWRKNATLFEPSHHVVGNDRLKLVFASSRAPP